ncbi:hypothetical protein HYO15_10415 [Vibrio parahaemolyticus]|nr:hypothetical protein [Vibrio parahaemolyticus]MDN4732925.1 hypothetical protein [Vibrio parahaemolyticus]
MSVQENNIKKVENTKDLFIEIINKPEEFKYDEAIRDALKSQDRIAKFKCEEREIVACSLNTLKTASERLLDRGFVEFNELRNNAKHALEEAMRGNKANKTTLVGMRHMIDELDQQLDITQRSNFLLITIISQMRSQLKKMSESDDSIEVRQELYRTFNKKIEAELNYTLNGEF